MSGPVLELLERPLGASAGGVAADRRRRTDVLVLAVIGAIVLARIAYVLAADVVALTFRTTDDAYYYFNVARNIALGYGSTFDRINPTNGYHPLWMLCLLPVYAVFGADPAAALRAVCVLVAVLAGATAWLAYRVAASGIDRSAGVFVLCLLPVPLFVNATLNGLETGLLLAALMLLLCAELRWEVFSPWASPGRNVALGALLAVVFLSRLDSAFIILALVAWMIGRGGNALRKTVVVGAVGAVLVGPYLFWNRIEYGRFVPISGALKSTFPDVSFTLERFRDFHTLVGLAQIVFSGAVIVAWAVLGRGTGRAGQPQREPGTTTPAARGAPRTEGIPAVVPAMYVGCLLHFAYAVLFMNWAAYWWHYASYLPVTLFLAAFAFLRIVAWAGDRPAVRVGLTAAALLGAVGLLFAEAQRRGTHHEPWYAAARWASDHLPDGSVIGMTDCGLFGYFCAHRTVNLDGVINGVAYQEALRDERLAEYLRDCGVTHVADYEVRYRDGRYRIRLPARLFRAPGGAIVAREGDEAYHSPPYENVFHGDRAIHFAIWPIDRVSIYDDAAAADRNQDAGRPSSRAETDG
jgi:hypothetical protein